MRAFDIAWDVIKSEVPPYDYNEEDAWDKMTSMGADDISLNAFGEGQYTEEYHPEFPIHPTAQVDERTLLTSLRGSYGYDGRNAALQYMQGDLSNNPVVVFIDRHGEQYLIDGHHRSAAHYIAGKEGIPTVVLREGDA